MPGADIRYRGSTAGTLIVERGSHSYPEDVNVLVIGKRFFYQEARYFQEYIDDTDPSGELLVDLEERGVDLFTFVRRSFMTPEKKYPFHCEDESISLLKVNSFNDWWKYQIRKEERKRIVKAEKKGIEIRSVRVDEAFIRGAQKIYNETPVRGGRRYTGYGLSLADVRKKFENLQRSDVFGAYGNDGLIGLLLMIYGDKVARIRSFLSFVKDRDKFPNNALMAEAVRKCCEKDFHFIVYARMGYLPGLDSFKKHNGFRECTIPRYFVPFSRRGMLAIKLKVHKEIEHALSPRVGRALLPVYSLAGRAIPLKILQRITQ